METIFTFPDGDEVIASSAEEAVEILNEREENPEGYTSEDAKMSKHEDIEEFSERFKPIYRNDKEPFDNPLFETYGEDLKTVMDLWQKDEKCIWTVVSGDSGLLYIIAGFHFVNRMNYIITELPWITGEEVYLY